MLSASVIATDIMMDGLNGSPPLLFRGCLAAGEMKEDVDFLIGPAVDEAAERFELSDGPFLWMAPSALDISDRFRETYLDRIEPIVMSTYAVPMNDGTSFDTKAFTYYALTQEATRWTETRQKLLDAFGKHPLTPNVNRKKQNLVTFLDHIESIASAGAWVKEELELQLPD